MENESKENFVETDAQIRARKLIHVVIALVIISIVAILIWGVSGAGAWAKARQQVAIQLTAKADLDLVLKAEKVFFEKNGFYTTDLNALQLWPKRVLYAFGFTKAADSPNAMAAPNADTNMRTILLLAQKRAKDAEDLAHRDPTYLPEPPIVLSPATGIREMNFDELTNYCQDCTATKTSFKLIAAANLDNDPDFDIWTIDQNGNVEHLFDDLKNDRPQ